MRIILILCALSLSACNHGDESKKATVSQSDYLKFNQSDQWDIEIENCFGSQMIYVSDERVRCY